MLNQTRTSALYPAMKWHRCERVGGDCGTFAAPVGATHCGRCGHSAIPVFETTTSTAANLPPKE